MKENYPNVNLEKNILNFFSNSKYVKLYNSKKEPDNTPSNPRLNVIITPHGKESHIKEYGIIDVE